MSFNTIHNKYNSCIKEYVRMCVLKHPLYGSEYIISIKDNEFSQPEKKEAV